MAGKTAATLLEIVIPAFNEAERLPHGLDLLGRELRRLDLSASIIVVDNASTDGTARIARDWHGPVPVRVMGCARKGKGAAVRTGLLATTAPYVGFCDADMATDLSALHEVLDRLGRGQHVVVGSRRHPDSDVRPRNAPLRRLGAITFNRLSRDLVGGVPDTQCGFKFFAGPLARAAAADLRTAGFAFDVELLMHCRRRGAPIHDLPVRWDDVDGSTFSVRRHSLGCLRDLLKIRIQALLPQAAPASRQVTTAEAARPRLVEAPGTGVG